MELLVLIPLIGFMLLWRQWHACSIAAAGLHAVSALILLLFVAGLSGLLPQTRIVLLALGVLALLLVVARHAKEAMQSLVSVPMVVLIVTCVGFFALHGDSHFRFYDEYSHWGIFLREMLANGGFWNADTNSLHPRYPPGPTLWQYLFVFSDIPRDGAAYLAQFILLLIPVLVLFESLSWKQAGWAFGVVALLMFGLGNFGHGIASLYVDHVLAVWTAGILLNFLAEPPQRRGFRALALYVLPLTALALIKDVGFFFALALAGLMAAVHLVRAGMLRRPLNPGAMALPAALLAAWFAGPLLATVTWSQNRDLAGAAEDVMSVGGLTGIVTGETSLDDPERAQVVRKRFAEVLLTQQLSKDRVSDRFNEFSYETMSLHEDRFRLTTAVFLVIYVVWSALLVTFVLHRSKRAEWGIVLLGMLGIAVGYTVMLYLSYQFVFPRRDAMSIASYIRYIHSVVLPMLLIAMAPLLPVFSGAGSDRGPERILLRPGAVAALFAFSLLALLFFEKPRVQHLVRSTPLPEFRAEIRPLTSKVREIADGQRVWTYFPDPNPHNVLSKVILFELTPTPAEIHTDPGFFDLPEEEILSELAGFDFVWITVHDEKAQGRLDNIAGAGAAARLFRVAKDNAQTRLVPVM